MWYEFRISVIVSTYNCLDKLKLCLKSLENQTYKDFELIIADDGSNDGTKEYMKSWEARCWFRRPPKYIRHEDNGYRLALTWNEGAKIAKGQRLLFTNSDIIFHKDFVKMHLSQDDNEVVVGIIKYLQRKHKVDKKLIASGTDSLISLSDEDPRVLGQHGEFAHNTEVGGHLMWGGNFSVSAKNFNLVNGFDSVSFVSYGGEDGDLGMRLVGIGCRVQANHLSFGYHIWHPVSKDKAKRGGSTVFKIKHGDNRVTAIVACWNRPRALNNLISSLRKYFPFMKILVANDSYDLITVRDKNTEVYRVGPGSGLSYCRNYLIDRVETEFTLLLDDDFVLTKETDINSMIATITENKVDIVGGQVINKHGKDTYLGILKVVDGRTLEMTKCKIKEINEIEYYDIITNFFVARTNILRRVRWNPNLIMGEHEDFFWRAKKQKVIVAFNPKSTIKHNFAYEEYPGKSGMSFVDMRWYYLKTALKSNGLNKFTINGEVIAFADNRKERYGVVECTKM